MWGGGGGGGLVEAAYFPRLSRKNGEIQNLSNYLQVFLSLWPITELYDCNVCYEYLRETGDYLLVNEDSRSYSLGLQFLSSR